MQQRQIEEYQDQYEQEAPSSPEVEEVKQRITINRQIEKVAPRGRPGRPSLNKKQNNRAVAPRDSSEED